MNEAHSYSFQSTGTMPVDVPSNSNGRSTPISGITTPQNGKVSTSSSFYGLPSLRSAWTGLVRTFSYDETPDLNPRAISQSTREVPPLESVFLSGWKSTTRDASRVLSVPLAEEIRKMVPERLQIVEGWNLVYSLVQDGTLLGTIYRKCAEFSEKRHGQRVGFVIVVRDDEGGVFGAYLSEAPHVSKSYYGNGECFLWRASKQVSLPPPPSADTTNMTRNTTLALELSTTTTAATSARASTSSLINLEDNPTEKYAVQVSIQTQRQQGLTRFKAYPYSGKNDYCILCEPGFLSLGAGNGHYGLWMNENLSAGHSDPCPTFDNEGLSDQGGKFGIIGVEVWAIGG